MKFSRPTHRAFTLIEIMVAIAIFSMVLAAIYSTWAAIMRSTRVAQDVTAQAQRQRVTLRTIEDSLMAIESFQGSPQYYSFIVENGSSPMLSFTAQVPEIFPRNGKFVNPNTGRDFNLRRLTFALEPDANNVNNNNNGQNLVLRQNPVLMDLDDDEQKYPLILAKNVREFTVECWDTNKLKWADEWLDTNAIPTLLRVNLVLGGNVAAGAAAPDVTVTRLFSIPSQTMPMFVQKGGAAGVPAPGAGGGPTIPLPVRR